MATISDLPEDLVYEIFSRVSLTSLSAVRCTCKRWNEITKFQMLGKKAARKNQYLEFMIKDYKVCSFRFDLQGIRNEDEDSVDPSLKQISIPYTDHQVKIHTHTLHHCDGLLLFCVTTKDGNSMLVVWNPYLDQTKWIRIRDQSRRCECDRFCLGYEDQNKNRNYKILRFDSFIKNEIVDVYDFSSDSWKVIPVSQDIQPFSDGGVSLKGNTYFICQKLIIGEDAEPELIQEIEDCIICFDFTRENFGPRLPSQFMLPWHDYLYLAVSWVRDDKLAVLYNYETVDIIDIWISTRIDPDALSWSKFLKLDMTLINGLPAGFSKKLGACSFFIDEESKVAVLFFADTYNKKETRQVACIFGDGRYFKPVYLGLVDESLQQSGLLVRSSYVPSLVSLARV